MMKLFNIESLPSCNVADEQEIRGDVENMLKQECSAMPSITLVVTRLTLCVGFATTVSISLSV